MTDELKFGDFRCRSISGGRVRIQYDGTILTFIAAVPTAQRSFQPNESIYMQAIIEALIFSIFLICSGCGRAEISEARKDHILSRDHGWIDLTLSQGAEVEGQTHDMPCALSLSINGESLLNESVDVAKLGGNQPAIGYRLPAPAGNLQTELTLSVCIKDKYTFKLPVDLAENNLVTLLFDGKRLTLRDSSAYDPTTLDWVRSEMQKIRSNDQLIGNSLSTLTWLVIASLTINVFAAFLLFRKKKM